jgi:hypothetical protein
VFAQVREVLANLKSATGEIDAVVRRNSPKVDAALDDVGRASKSIASAAKEFEGLGTRVHSILGDAGGDLDRFLAHVAEMGHNLADMTEDLRAHPWKLVNKPDDKEIAFENLHVASSNYVRSSQAIDDALAKIKQIEGRTDLADPDKKILLEKAAGDLRAELAKFEERARFFMRMFQSGAVTPPR